MNSGENLKIMISDHYKYNVAPVSCQPILGLGQSIAIRENGIRWQNAR